MIDEKARLQEAIIDEEGTLQSIDDEMREIENEHPDFETREDWNDLYVEHTEVQNSIDYMLHCLEEYE